MALRMESPVMGIGKSLSGAENLLPTVLIVSTQNTSATNRGVVQVLRGYTEEEVETLDEAALDGILRDYRSAHVLAAIIDAGKDTVTA